MLFRSTFASGLSTNVYQKVDPFACITPTSTDPASPGNPLCAHDTPAGTYPGGLGMAGSPNGDISPRPDLVAPIHLTKTQSQWFTTSSFAVAQGHFGNGGVGNFLSPGEEKIDLGLMKNINFGHDINLQLRAEAFNLFNHTNFSIIDLGLGDAQYGQATAAHAARIMQFSGKLYF